LIFLGSGLADLQLVAAGSLWAPFAQQAAAPVDRQFSVQELAAAVMMMPDRRSGAIAGRQTSGRRLQKSLCAVKPT